jgi:hypothetical protein
MPRPARRPLLAAALAALLFAMATPWALRPWFLETDRFPSASGPATAMLNADLYLNVWILAWEAHAALHEPSRLFDGNVYHPAPGAILGSENMLAHLPVTAPALALSGNALVVLKAMAFESFVLAGLAMFAFVWRRTRDPVAGLVAGAAYAFTPIRVETLPQPQYLGTMYLPLALLAVDVLADTGSRRAAVGLALALAMQALACVYVGFFTFVAVPVYALVRLARVPLARRARTGVAALAAFAAAGALLVPVAWPYLRARSLGVIPPHDAATVLAFSWPAWIWLTPAAWHKIGVVAPVVVALDVLARLGRRLAGASRPALGPAPGLWAVAAVGVLFAAGPYLALGSWRLPLPYLALYHLVPGFSTIRAPLRFYVVVSAALSALAGLAFARWAGGLPRLARSTLATALAVGALWHAAPAPMPTMAAHLGRHAAPVYRWLAAQPNEGAVLELPAQLVPNDVTGNLRSSRYMVASTIHWKPIVNGYTAYSPPTAGLLAAVGRRLPDPDALQLLVDLVDVRWVVVHYGDFTPWERRAWENVDTPGLERAGRFGMDEVWTVTRAPDRPWRGDLLRRAYAPQPRTLEGTPIRPLADACRRGRILSVAPPAVMYPMPLPFAAALRFENTSDCAWPGLDVRREGLVGVTYRWVSPSGVPLRSGPFTRLVRDVPPHATVDGSIVIAPPSAEFGTWTCEIALTQYGVDAPPIARTTATVDLQPWPSRRQRTSK